MGTISSRQCGLPSRAVHTVRCADYADALPLAFARLLSESAILSVDTTRGKHVLVKPNLLTDRTPDKAVTTHPALLRLVLRHLKSSGATVSVGDSPASAANLGAVLDRGMCIGCACCHEVCPRDAIRMTPSPVLKLVHAFGGME